MNQSWGFLWNWSLEGLPQRAASMWSRALCISSGWPLGRVKKNTRHHLPTDLDQCVCKCMPQVHLQTHWLSLTCEPITTPAQPPETLSVTPEYCRFASGVSVTTKSWHDNPPATCQTCVCAHLHFFTTFVFVSSRLYLMHSNCSFLRR